MLDVGIHGSFLGLLKASIVLSDGAFKRSVRSSDCKNRQFSLPKTSSAIWIHFPHLLSKPYHSGETYIGFVRLEYTRVFLEATFVRHLSNYDSSDSNVDETESSIEDDRAIGAISILQNWLIANSALKQRKPGSISKIWRNFALTEMNVKDLGMDIALPNE
jgi:hypothetical protein